MMASMTARGFTLFEVLLTLSIVAIWMLIASPDFRTAYSSLKLLTLRQQIIQELHLARSEAIKRQQDVIYCTEENKTWDKRRFIKNRSGIMLHTFQAIPSSYHLVLFNSLGKNQAMTFTPLGFTKEERSSFYLYSPAETIRITITVSGRVRSERIMSDSVTKSSGA
jgi:type IV fimbrial biogenesis protein FimT